MVVDWGAQIVNMDFVKNIEPVQRLCGHMLVVSLKQMYQNKKIYQKMKYWKISPLFYFEGSTNKKKRKINLLWLSTNPLPLI